MKIIEEARKKQEKADRLSKEAIVEEFGRHSEKSPNGDGPEFEEKFEIPIQYLPKFDAVSFQYFNEDGDPEKTEISRPEAFALLDGLKKLLETEVAE